MQPVRHPRAAPVIVMLIALAHGLIYALGMPLWQTPDEPMLYEYAALTAELGRVPASQDHSPALERRLVAAMNRQGFWGYAIHRTPDPLPTSMGDALRSFPMPRQVGGDPPVYFVLAALPLRLTAGWPVEAQVRLLRVLSALLLPLAALCAYQIAREVGAPPPADLAAAGLVALQPMYTFIGTGLSNDGLANLASAGVCLLIVRALRRGLPARPVAAAIGLGLLALQIKRTALPLALAAGALGAVWIGRALLRPSARRPGILWPGLLSGLALIAAGGVWLSGQVTWGQADRWYDARSLYPAPRSARGAGYVLTLSPNQAATQTLPDVAVVYLRNRSVEVGARIWCDGPTTVRLLLDTGVRQQETRFALDGVADATMTASVSSIADHVRLSIAAEGSPIAIGRVWMRGVGLPGELITNGDMARPALRYDSPLVPLTRYLRLTDLLWIVESGRAGWGLAADEWLRWAFVSFWGHFGWMDIAVVRGSPWEPTIAGACALGLAGCGLALARGGRRAPLAALPALVGGGLALLYLNAQIDAYPIQQGRYLFPLLPALAVTLAAGQAALVPARLRPLWLIAWLSFWLSLAGAALFTLAATYS